MQLYIKVWASKYGRIMADGFGKEKKMPWYVISIIYKPILGYVFYLYMYDHFLLSIYGHGGEIELKSTQVAFCH